jgi:hypothetical protein
MLKEILEEPEALNKTYDGNSEKVKVIADNILKKVQRRHVHNGFWD